MAKRRSITFDWEVKLLLQSKANFEILDGFLSELLKNSIRNKERQAYARYVDDLHYEASMVESSYCWGVIKGIKMGIKIGTELGIKLGGKQRAVEIAANLIDILDAETIALKTGVTIEEVKAINGYETDIRTDYHK
ncbi:hypothetical protein QUF90_13105 [Desulfococcaceae bacterium HSG9]|nr:hypothetical protein [Desulfococcaceae bacterium HSG9]